VRLKSLPIEPILGHSVSVSVLVSVFFFNRAIERVRHDLLALLNKVNPVGFEQKVLARVGEFV